MVNILASEGEEKTEVGGQEDDWGTRGPQEAAHPAWPPSPTTDQGFDHSWHE